MKIIDNNGKLLGKINIIDIIAILLIILAIVIVLVRFVLPSNNNTNKGNVVVEYTIKIPAIRQVTYESLLKENEVYSSPNADEKVYVGTICKDIEKNDAKVLTQLDSGEYAYISEEGKYDLIITISCSVTKNDEGYFFDKKTQLLVNDEFSIYNGYAKVTGTISSIVEK